MNDVFAKKYADAIKKSCRKNDDFSRSTKEIFRAVFAEEKNSEYFKEFFEEMRKDGKKAD